LSPTPYLNRRDKACLVFPTTNLNPKKLRIEIKNFGPIDHLEFDLEKDIHLIYGKNSVGKSYAIYCVYLVLKNLTNQLRTNNAYVFSDLAEELPEIFNFNLELLEVNQTLDITEEFKLAFGIFWYKIFGSSLKNSLLNTFSSISSLHNQYANQKFEIILHNSKDLSFKVVSNNENDIKIIYQDKRFTKVNIKKESEYKILANDLFYEPEGDLLSTNQVLNEIRLLIFQVLVNAISDVLINLKFLLHFLPASRSGLYQGLNALGPIMAELSKSRHLLRSTKIELPTLSEPVSDYYLDISTVDKSRMNVEFQEMIDFLQKEVLKGEVHYDNESKKIYYSPNDIDINLELSKSSSMISEMSPLVIYLKHIINNKFDLENGYIDTSSVKEKMKSILFIEEPEAHLHPEIQVKLMELFTKLPKYGIKIFITSHSNYMFNKLNNMLIKKEVDSEKVVVYHLVKEENGTIDKKDMEVTPDGVNDENFQDVTEQLYYERLNYLEGDDDDKEN